MSCCSFMYKKNVKYQLSLKISQNIYFVSMEAATASINFDLLQLKICKFRTLKIYFKFSYTAINK